MSNSRNVSAFPLDSDGKPTIVAGIDNVGQKFTSSDGKKEFVVAYGTTTVGLSYMLTAVATANQEVQAAACATMAIAEVGVACATVTAGYVWLQTKGDCTFAVVGTAAAGDSVELINAGTYLIADASAYSVKTIAIVKTAVTLTTAATKVYLVGGTRLVSAS